MNSAVMDRGATVAPSSASVPPPAASVSAVSWAAIFAGAAGAAALSLILLVLGVGLGFSAMSPWHDAGASATTLGVSSIIWIILTSLFASGLGGYIAGRLRTRWLGTHTDEVYFRDTAHGFLAWSVATLITAGVLTSAIGSIVGGGVQAGASAVGGVASTAASAAAAGGAAAAGRSSSDNGSSSLPYFTDSLFRRDPSAAPQGDPNANAASNSSEVTRIFVQSLRSGTLSADDTHYVGQLVAQRTGLSQQDAEKRVTDTFNRAKAAADDAANKAKDAADKARKAAAYASLWIFVSLLVGAFSASLMATYGGRRRDL